MPAWYSSLPVMIQWLVVAPCAIYLLGLSIVLGEPSAQSQCKGKAGWFIVPMGLGLIATGFLATIFGATMLLSLVLPYWLAFVICLPLGMVLFMMLGSGLSWIIEAFRTLSKKPKR